MKNNQIQDIIFVDFKKIISWQAFDHANKINH